mmetsp:Transcript_2959/g.4435  ORF Transcript_2959/g.4435 Transcript_2959/m.4435 type:complete len:93 (-) Transcript_2959:988-1266(-)
MPNPESPTFTRFLEGVKKAKPFHSNQDEMEKMKSFHRAPSRGFVVVRMPPSKSTAWSIPNIRVVLPVCKKVSTCKRWLVRSVILSPAILPPS